MDVSTGPVMQPASAAPGTATLMATAISTVKRRLRSTRSIVRFVTGSVKLVCDRAFQACTLKISGMVCSACAGTVERAAKKIAGVKTAKASRPKDVAEITYDPTKTSPDAIAKALMRTTPFQAEVSQSESKG